MRIFSSIKTAWNELIKVLEILTLTITKRDELIDKIEAVSSISIKLNLLCTKRFAIELF